MKKILNGSPSLRNKEGAKQRTETGQKPFKIPAGKLRLTPGWGYVVSASALGVSMGNLPAVLEAEEFIGNGYGFRLFQRNSEGSGIYLQELGSTVLTVVKE